ncbi:MAG: ParA family protein [Candidatus Dormibacteraeota bacterium]|nr:ParA family protein [Candidatus Dormibacteraeota bacterium]
MPRCLDRVTAVRFVAAHEVAIALAHNRIVTIAATKGGAGKTATAVALTGQLNALQPNSTRLLDADPQRTAAKWLSDITTAARIGTSADVRALATARITIVDTPPGESPALPAAIEAADVVVAVTALGAGDLEGLADLLKMVDPHLVIPTGYDARVRLHGTSMLHLYRRFGDRLSMPVPNAASVQYAQAEHRPLNEGTPPAIAYAHAAARLLALLNNAQGVVPDGAAQEAQPVHHG